MKNASKVLLSRVAQSRAGQAVAAVVSFFAANAAMATGTTLTVLPSAAATATDTLISAAVDVSTILFGIGIPFILAYLGYKIFKKAAHQGVAG